MASSNGLVLVPVAATAAVASVVRVLLLRNKEPARRLAR
jgi:hypothetical protein